MEVFETMARTWLSDLMNRDPLAIGLGAGLFVAGSVLTTAGTRLGGKATFALAGLAWRAIRWLTKPKPPRELAALILKTMEDKSPREEGAHTLWYGDCLHIHAGNIWVDADTCVNRLLSRAERKAILRRANFDRDYLAMGKIMDLRRDAETVELNPCV